VTARPARAVAGGPLGALASRHPRRALWAAWALLACGVAGAGFLAQSTYSSAQDRAHTAFRANAASVASSVLTAARRDEDFVVAQAAMFGTVPHMTNRLYQRWMQGTESITRYPGGLGFTFVERVPAAGLARFAVALAQDPPAQLAVPAPGRFQPWPPGPRSQYCLMRYAVSLVRLNPSVTGVMPVTYDFCAPLGKLSPFPALFSAAAATGALAVGPPISYYPGVFYVVAPVYEQGSAPPSPGARRSEVAGWVVGSFSTKTAVSSALVGARHYQVRLSYLEPALAKASSQSFLIAASQGQAGAEHYSATVGTLAGGRWVVDVSGPVGPGAGSLALSGGLLVLAAALLLGVSVRVLARSRQRALAIVEEQTEELRHQALHDPLTGLANRALVTDRLRHLLARAQREPLAFGVLLIDLDNFKDINDSFGHQRGDELLKAVGARLAELVRPGDSVGRLGGDEFVLLVEGSSSAAGPEAVARRALDGLSEPFHLEGLAGVELRVQASIGIAAGGPTRSAEDLLRDADVALYQAKRRGRARYVVFQPDMALAVQDHLALEMDLSRALAEGQVTVEYQPIFDLATLKLAGVEALARWYHPKRGPVPPSQFVPLAEESGLIGRLGRLVLESSCQQVAGWSHDGEPLALSVNVSGCQLTSDGFLDEVAAALAASGLAPSLLTLELTESVLMVDAQAAVERLGALRDLGVRLAIDDFGTGYSSLAYLRRFKVDELKVDRCFVSDVGSSEEARTVTAALVQLGRSLGLEVVAEGIEDEGQLLELQLEGFQRGQGFFYSRPLPPEVLEERFHLRARAAAAGAH